MKHKRLRKTQEARVYSSIMPCEFKYVSDVQLPISSHNLLKRGHFLLSGKRDALKYYGFLAERRLPAVPPGLSEAVVRLRLGELSGATIYLQLGKAIV